MRGLKVVRRFGVGTVWLNEVMLKFGSRMTALITASSSISRFSKSTKNEAFFFEIGPLKLPPYCRDEYAARVGANGLRAFNAMLLKPKEAWPRKRSVPGLVRISIPPKPGRSPWAENGFELSRISRI